MDNLDRQDQLELEAIRVKARADLAVAFSNTVVAQNILSSVLNELASANRTLDERTFVGSRQKSLLFSHLRSVVSYLEDTMRQLDNV